ncbi:MAG: hypothetical protein WEB04_03475 [Dehalococcoidia bacterium]
MYTQEVIEAMVDDRQREAVQIERQARAMRARRWDGTPRGVPSQEPDRSFISSVRRAVRSATALL